MFGFVILVLQISVCHPEFVLFESIRAARVIVCVYKL
uniref:Uncharacterized protein n=1 Tax=Arundo donax TaxID=35708 RepID=A0A0A9EIN8_ARUDO